MTLVLIFFFGLAVGSFLNVVIHRLHTGQSIVADSSRCPNCDHKLSAPDLIPVVSFFVLGRRCRYCKKSISWQYPLVELITAFSFVLAYANFQFSISNFQSIFNAQFIQFLFQLVFVCFLIVIFVYDLKHYLILDAVILPAAVLTGVYQLWQGHVVSAFLGAALLSGFFALLYLVSRGRWIGFGDVKLAVFLGLLVPWPETLALFFLAYLLGAVTGIILLAWGARRLSDRLPFGTFLTLSAFLAMLWGKEMVDWYFRLIGWT